MDSIAIIDLDSVAYTIGHPNKVLDENGIPKREDSKFVYIDKTNEELSLCVDKVLSDILNSSNATHYVGFIKGKNTIGDRKCINPEYKANRSIEQPKWWNFVKTCLIMNCGAIEVNNIEVDDAVNITRLNIPNSFICAIDKDLLSLEGKHYNWRKKEWINIDNLKANYNFWGDMIIGQVGDNIKGVPGKGVKYTQKLFEENLGIPLSSLVLNEYINYFGEEEGINEFYKNYKVLKIKDCWESFKIPSPVRFENNKISEFKKENY